jgi:hypothetical protein
MAMAEWIEKHLVRITWKDGSVRIVDLHGAITKHDIYRPLAVNDALFSQLRLDEQGTAVEWPNGLDFSALYISRLPFTEAERTSVAGSVVCRGAGDP